MRLKKKNLILLVYERSSGLVRFPSPYILCGYTAHRTQFDPHIKSSIVICSIKKKFEIYKNFGFRRGVLLRGFCAASLGNLLPTRRPETSVANYPLTLQNIPEDRNPKILNIFSNSHYSWF